MQGENVGKCERKGGNRTYEKLNGKEKCKMYAIKITIANKDLLGFNIDAALEGHIYKFLP
jgi:hypothetical protein